MSRFAGKRVLITGAGQGIGRAISLAFAREGAFIALNDLDAGLAQAAADAINAEVGAARVTPLAFDTADVDAVRAAFAAYRTVPESGTPEIVIANAGLTHFSPSLAITPATFDRVMAVNLRGTFFTAQTGAQAMIDAGIRGRILLMSSCVGVRPYNGLGIYSVSKAGIIMMAQTLASEWGRYGITVNSISPGATLTERTQREEPDYERVWGTINITGRVGQVDDIAAAALFLAAPEAGQITGHNLLVDGGWALVTPVSNG
ncbi:MAG: SDR family oxidoreductase [bacterium]|nr:SDR family oxidoreductase [bacterium]